MIALQLMRALPAPAVTAQPVRNGLTRRILQHFSRRDRMNRSASCMTRCTFSVPRWMWPALHDVLQPTTALLQSVFPAAARSGITPKKHGQRSYASSRSGSRHYSRLIGAITLVPEALHLLCQQVEPLAPRLHILYQISCQSCHRLRSNTGQSLPNHGSALQGTGSHLADQCPACDGHSFRKSRCTRCILSAQRSSLCATVYIS